MDQQLELLSRDRMRHNVYLAALPNAAIADCAKEIAGNMRRRFGLIAKPIAAERLHVSLLSVGDFSGSYPPAVIDAAMRAADTVSMAPFKVEFDRFASFSGGQGKRAQVLTSYGDGVAGFLRLQEVLVHALMKAGLRLPRQSGGAPHMTLMYDDRVCDCPIEPVGWTVDRFVLVDSLVGQSRHVYLGQWFL